MQAELLKVPADRLEEHAPHYRLTNLQYRQVLPGDCRQLMSLTKQPAPPSAHLEQQ